MKILFKSDTDIYYIEDSKLTLIHISSKILPDIDLDTIPHLDDIKPIYHYRNTKNGALYSVYYEHNGRFISDKYYGYTWFYTEDYIKDYTLVNLSLI